MIFVLVKQKVQVLLTNQNTNARKKNWNQNEKLMVWFISKSQNRWIFSLYVLFALWMKLRMIYTLFLLYSFSFWFFLFTNRFMDEQKILLFILLYLRTKSYSFKSKPQKKRNKRNETLNNMYRINRSFAIITS